MNEIIVGDVRAKLRELPEGIAQTCVTSPPYWGLRDYGVAGQIGLEPTPQEYVTTMVDVFREVRRVLKDDGTLWLNLGDSYSNAGTRQGDRGGSVSNGKVNDHRAFYRPTCPGLKNKDLVGIPWRVAFALQADGWWLRSDIIWSKPNPMPESVTDRPTKAHEYLFLLAKSETYYYDAAAISEAIADVTYRDRVDGDRFRPERGFPGAPSSGSGRLGASERRNKRTVWTITTKPYTEAHFATFPEDLVQPCILAGCPEGGVVLDPFMGSGTTALVALKANRKFIGVELSPVYAEMARARIAPELNQMRLA